MRKIVFTEFFTTLTLKHFTESLKFITYKIFYLRKWNSILKLEKYLLDFLWLKDSKIISFYNWRTALYHTLKLIWTKKKDEIIINWYNCISVSNSIIQAKWIPIYCDIKKTNFWIDTGVLEKKITKKTKAIVIQHTFWKTPDLKNILKIAKQNNILIIEDCAHSLWSIYEWKKHWSFWDFAIFSTWRDKVISWINGGFLVINNKDFFKKTTKEIKKIKLPNRWLVIKNHLYNILWFISLKTYNLFWLWKVIIFLSRKLNLIVEVLSKSEKICKNKNLNFILPNSLASLALNDFWNIEKYINHRRVLYEYYFENIKSKYCKIPFFENKNETVNAFRAPLIFKNKKIKDIFYKYMKNNWFIFWNSWSDSNIAPKSSSKKGALYLDNCKIAEDIAGRLLLIPNHDNVSIDQAKYITDLINNFNINDL